MATNPAQKTPQPDARGGSPSLRLASGPPPVYRQMSDLPAYTEISSKPEGVYTLKTRALESMFVLKLENPKNTFAVIATRDVFNSAAYIGLVQRIQDNGHSVASCGIADGSLVSRIYKDSVDDFLSEDDIKPIVREIDTLAQAALDRGASDIHIESRATTARVLMRVNGEMEGYSDSWASSHAKQMARALHTIADEDSKDTTFSTEGQLSVSRTLSASGMRVKLRVQLSTAYPDDGLDVVIRVLRVAASANTKSLTKLGFAPEHLEMVDYMLSSPEGMLVVCGTTGSGKSTTLQTGMSEIHKNNTGLKLISIEDPPEYVLEGVTQIPVPRRRNQRADDNPFTNAMRNTMRMDPDVIMVGEIRDSESAKLMVSMVQSGHKVLTSLHTSSALSVIERLLSMGVEASVLGARCFISGVIYQTLVPVLCDACRVDYSPTMTHLKPALHERIKRVTRPGDTLFVKAEGTPEHPHVCPKCRNTGVVDRTVCAEMVIPDSVILDCVRKNDMSRAHDHWRSLRRGKPETSMIGATALEHAILKMRRGEVAPDAVEKALGLLHDFSQDTGIASIEASDLLGLESI